MGRARGGLGNAAGQQVRRVGRDEVGERRRAGRQVGAQAGWGNRRPELHGQVRASLRAGARVGGIAGEAGAGRARRAARLLATLLDVGADEVLGVLLQHVVDLVEDRVDVLAELLATLLTRRARRRPPRRRRRRRRPDAWSAPATSSPPRRCRVRSLPAAPTFAPQRPLRSRCGGGSTSSRRSAGEGLDQLLGRAASCRSARRRAPGAAQRLQGRDPHQRLPAQVEDHRVPGRGGDLGRRSAPGSGRGSRPGCPPAGSSSRRAPAPR